LANPSGGVKKTGRFRILGDRNKATKLNSTDREMTRNPKVGMQLRGGKVGQEGKWDGGREGGKGGWKIERGKVEMVCQERD
jgi:hypothetical protein